MLMTSVVVSLGTSRKECTSQENVLKSRCYLWKQNFGSWCFYERQGSV